MPIDKKHRFIHSFWVTSVAVPVWELLKRGAIRILQQFLQDKVLGNAIPSSELENEINAFLQANRLDERGERNDLLEALLQKNDGRQVSYTLLRDREELEREAGGSEIKQAEYIANRIDNEMNRIRIEIVLEVQEVAKGRKVEVLLKAISAIAGRLETLVKTKGLHAAQSFVAQLIFIFETIQNELAKHAGCYSNF